ncbi:aminoglycoside phosphotransferase (APT) family kinase protein [Mumia flava]|uniref:Aminoglycoside phosphotransferase (APT) family kinase protein n=1 Tax=Mumia flava TaxID=1348852 RepID=A0A0B2BQW0_9ACTN|nr:phosphotransferase family protein [Mumia flava]PJJ48199.1 aminoglycoside phosphotransferase (APT) family kinase protein [Mumia flava]
MSTATPSDPAHERAQRLQQLVRDATGTAGPVLLERLTGGASRETLAVTTGDGDEQQLVLRIDETGGLGGVSLQVEAAAMRAADDAGVAVPRVHAVGTDPALGAAYMLMDRIDGETIARRILRDDRFAAARTGLVGELGATLARLHTIEVGDDLLAPAPEPLAALDDLAGARPPAPGLALGLRALHDERPEPGAECLVHGDFRLGNLMVGPDGLRAVLDWELVHRGDPVEDLGWLCAKVWRFGSPHPAGGLGTRDELLDAYAEVAGWRPSDARLAWWERYATVRWGLMCRVQADRHLSGAERSMEMVAIGRRSAEQEFDVLLGLGLDHPHETREVLDDAPPAATGPYGSPTSDDLLDGLLHFLGTEVVPAGGSVGFQARVATNLARTVRREARLGEEHRARHRVRLDRLGVADDDELSRAIVTGSLDDRWEAVAEVVRESVRDRLAVANPAHTAQPG